MFEKIKGIFSKHSSLIAAGIYLALSAERMAAYLHDGRFWAEEGKYYFSAISQMSFIGGLFFERNGHVEFLTNLVIAISALAPLKYAPLVSTYLSFALQCIPVFYLIKYHHRIGLTKIALCALMIIAVGLPQAAEIWANSINLHFHFALLAALIAVLPASSEYRPAHTLPLLVMAGLSGIPANFMTPVFLWLALREKNSLRWMQFSALLITSIAQFCILYTNDFNAGPRDMGANPAIYWLAMLSHQIISPFLEYPEAKWCTNLLRQVLTWDAWAVTFAAICSTPILLLLRNAIITKDTQQKTILLSSFTLGVLSILGSLGERWMYIAPISGGRYFYAANVLLAIYLFKTLWLCRPFFYKAILVWLVAFSFMHTEHNMGGPDWLVSYKQAIMFNDKTIHIWPGGDEWTIPNFEYIKDALHE
ncbi:MAG: hypothetical protein QM749_06500 [Aquabacterium sp.]